MSPQSALSLEAVLDGTLGMRAPPVRNLAKVLADCRGRHPGADAVAHALGLNDRHQLVRALRKARLPNLTELAAWTRLLDWRLSTETAHQSLLSLTLEEARDAAERYRTASRLTGIGWSDVREREAAWLVERFATRMRGPRM